MPLLLSWLARAAESLEHLTVPMLKQQLRQRGLPVSGRKAELVRRLSAAPKDETEELTELTVVKLRQRLRERGLPVSGRKEELILRLSCQLRGGRSETPQRDEAGEELSLWTRQSPNCLEEEQFSLPTGKWLRGVVRSVMTYGVFVELELKGGSTLWGFIAPEKLKRQHQSWRGEEGNLKAYVKKDALKLAQELKVRVLPTSAMSNHLFLSSCEASAEPKPDNA